LLSLGDNNIGAEGAKAIAASLRGLTSLSLGDNNIGAEGAKALLDAWSLELRNGQLSNLDLRNNSDLGGLLPREVLETTDGQAILAAYRRFILAQEKQTLRPLNELKLLVVGNEAVGKTSLLQYLIRGKPRDPKEPKTPGIVQHERIQIQGWSPHDCQIQLNVWDFGGQEMMRGTHRFFLTERSLYLLVLEDRRQDDRSIYDWMKTIRNRGGSSPVIVVINKSDEGKQDLRLDENTLQTTYSNIVSFLRTSCDPGDWASASIERLRLKIVDTITQHENLKHVRDPIPANWLWVKSRVRELADQRAVLPYADFIALCKEDPGDGTEPIVGENEQRALLRLLHELGAIVAHGLERDAPAARREINLLDPNWLTGAVYHILDKARSVDQEGEFVRRQLVDWLDPGWYPPERHEFILDMMQDRDIGLCFRLPTSREECYLIPEALPANSRFFGKWPENSLRFRYVYNYLPPSLIPRFIVQSHGNLIQKSRWRTGAVLEVSGCEVLVLADPDRRRVDLQVTGPPALRRPALNVLLNHLELVHQLHPEAEAVAFVPVPDNPEVHVSYEHLLKLERLQGPTFPYFPDGANRSYPVGELLDGVRRDEEKQTVHNLSPKTKPHVVIFVHGIRTRALWQNELRKSLQGNGFVVQPTNYGYFDVVRFLFPYHLLAGKVINEVTSQIRHTRSINRDADYSIVAHSFGTFIVAKILKDHTDLEFNRIIFCGSVVPRKFPLEDYRKNFRGDLINEVGPRDFWPVMAEVVTFGYGSSGTYGFRRPPVRDRWHNGKAHSDFLNEEFCEVVDDDERTESPPRWLWAISTFQIKFLVLLVAAIALLYRGWLTAAWSALGAG
jgi:internalin A